MCMWFCDIFFCSCCRHDNEKKLCIRSYWLAHAVTGTNIHLIYFYVLKSQYVEPYLLEAIAFGSSLEVDSNACIILNSFFNLLTPLKHDICMRVRSNPLWMCIDDPVHLSAIHDWNICQENNSEAEQLEVSVILEHCVNLISAVYGVWHTREAI